MVALELRKKRLGIGTLYSEWQVAWRLSAGAVYES